MNSFWDDLPRGTPVCLILAIGILLILAGFILQRFLPGAVNVAFVVMVLLFATIICIFGYKFGDLD